MTESRYVCPICNTGSTSSCQHCKQGYVHTIECPRCGKYLLSANAKTEIEKVFRMDAGQIDEYAKMEFRSTYKEHIDFYIAVAKIDIEKSRAIISHVIRKYKPTTIIRLKDLWNYLKNYSLPTPAELANNVIMFLGEHLSSPGDVFRVPPCVQIVETAKICGELGIRVGKEWDDLNFIITSLGEQKIINVGYERAQEIGGLAPGRNDNRKITRPDNAKFPHPWV